MKIFLADDAALIREGLAGILDRSGHEVVGTAATAPKMLERVRELLMDPQSSGIDVLITDVRMPPTFTDDGLRAAVELREEFPELSVLVLSQYVAPSYASVLFAPEGQAVPGFGGFGALTPVGGDSIRSKVSNKTGGLGYLLKDRISDVADFMRSLGIIATGGIVIDPEVAAGLIRGKGSSLDALTAREREVLELMAQGMSNSQIADYLFLSHAAVSKHVANVFLKLGLHPGEENRRVRAVLTYLTAAGIS